MIDTDYLLQRIDLRDLVQQHLGARLDRQGRGTCPLHHGDNATAFSIFEGQDGRQRWHCHTHCGGGDAIALVQRWRNLPDDADGFLEAVRFLIEYAGLTPAAVGLDTNEDPAQRERRQQERDLLRLAADYYTALLWSEAGQAGLDYARGRGWTDDTIQALDLGYSDGRLLAHLVQAGASLDRAAEIGLLSQRDEALYDAIPAGYLVYAHRQGSRVTYLSGRATSAEQKPKARNMRGPKYLYWARQPHRGPLVIVEGQADAITAWQWGYTAVALCGSALNPDHPDLAALRQYQAVHLILDADAENKVAGVADILGPLTMIVAGLPAKDLNDWLQAGGTRADLAVLLDQARPWLDLAIDQARQAPAYALDEHLDHLAHLVIRLAPAAQGRYIREICDRHRLCVAKDFRQLLEAVAAGSNNGAGAFEIIDGHLTCYGEPLGNWAAQITHELIQDDGLNPPAIVYTVAGELDTGDKLEPVEVRAEDFEGMRWVGKHWGARPIIYVPPGRVYQLRRAVQEVSRAELQRERVYTYTGWATVEGQRRYLTASGGLGADGLDPAVRVDLGNNNLGRYALPAPPADLRPAIAASLEFLDLAPPGVTLPLWLAMYAAPLAPIQTLNAIMWVYGITQSGKSTLSHLALAHFGPNFIQGHEYRAPKDWTSTATDLEGAMFAVKDAPIILDDYAPAHAGASEARAMSRKAHYVVRSVGNRSARGRANADLTERLQRPPRGLVIATAESPLVGQSIVGRMIYVAVEAGQVIQPDQPANGDTPLDRAQHQAQQGLYAQAMAGYVIWLACHWDRLARELPESIAQYSRLGRGLFPAGQSRLTDYYGLLAATLHTVLAYATDSGGCNADDAAVIGEAYRHALVDLLRSQSDRVAAQSPVLKFWQALSDLAAQSKVYFAPRLSEDYVPPYQAELMGWYDQEQGQITRIYLLTNVALSQAKTYWAALDERFDTLGDALRREMWQQGLVVERDGGQMERKCYINRQAGRQRVLLIDPLALREHCGFALGDQDE
ncbi:MAG: DUF927 domain-containing protein [Chloroflexi bacterium]|nr:DUF927 domain-containing protein [Chloroflexota bacterium]MBU1747160.1 DUF927 domain-containing protein [Chloroflexota bacterium]